MMMTMMMRWKTRVNKMSFWKKKKQNSPRRKRKEDKRGCGKDETPRIELRQKSNRIRTSRGRGTSDRWVLRDRAGTGEAQPTSGGQPAEMERSRPRTAVLQTDRMGHGGTSRPLEGAVCMHAQEKTRKIVHLIEKRCNYRPLTNLPQEEEEDQRTT
jgi:hypothetical protein